MATADGFGTNEIVRRSDLSKPNFWHWQERFMYDGVDRLLRDKIRPPGKPPVPQDTMQRVLDLTVNEQIDEATSHWTVRMMADAVGEASVHRTQKAHGLVPHRIRIFEFSSDLNFASKLRDVVGLYVDPSAHTITHSVDQKSQIQGLDRTQSGLPMRPGRSGTLNHDDKRSGTTTLFAALKTLDGSVIGCGI